MRWLCKMCSVEFHLKLIIQYLHLKVRTAVLKFIFPVSECDLGLMGVLILIIIQ